MSYIYSENRIKEFQKRVLVWYSDNKRTLPWRETTDPYAIMISEFMLQQTQVNRVLKYYEKFLKRYPTVQHLARARTSTVLKMWSGLGYNRRALYMLESAKKIVTQFDGSVPADYDALLSLPGFGDYMASAVLAFAFNKKAAVIDANIRRVYVHEFGLPPSVSMKSLKEIVINFVPRGKSRVWHNALMDYGSALSTEIKKSIPPVTTQKKFHGSFRQLRGKIIKILLNEKMLQISVLSALLRDDRMDKALTDLRNEGFIRIDHEMVII